MSDVFKPRKSEWKHSDKKLGKAVKKMLEKMPKFKTLSKKASGGIASGMRRFNKGGKV